MGPEPQRRIVGSAHIVHQPLSPDSRPSDQRLQRRRANSRITVRDLAQAVPVGSAGKVHAGSTGARRGAGERHASAQGYGAIDVTIKGYSAIVSRSCPANERDEELLDMGIPPAARRRPGRAGEPAASVPTMDNAVKERADGKRRAAASSQCRDAICEGGRSTPAIGGIGDEPTTSDATPAGPGYSGGYYSGHRCPCGGALRAWGRRTSSGLLTGFGILPLRWCCRELRSGRHQVGELQRLFPLWVLAV